MTRSKTIVVLAFAGLALAGCATMGATGVADPTPRALAMLVASTRPPLARAEALPADARNARFYRETITVPPGRAVGTLDRPRFGGASPRRHFTLAERTPLDGDLFRAELAAALARRSADQRDVLVFVHGYNTDHEEAVFRLAQLAEDAGFRGVPVAFSWPSYRRLMAYAGDREVATASRDAFDKLLGDIGATVGVLRVHILAHSMGAFLTMEGLRQAAIAGRGTLNGKLGEVILAAPDLDVEVFRAQVAHLDRPSRVSLFVQSDDRALAAASTIAWDRQRVGALDVRDARHREIISSLGVQVFTMRGNAWNDLVRHGTFAEAPEIVRLIGGRIGGGEGRVAPIAARDVSVAPETGRPDAEVE